MKVWITVCSILLMIGLASANDWQEQAAKTSDADLQHVLELKAAGALDMNDPAYVRLVNESRAAFAREHGGISLDQGADNCPATNIPGLPYTDTGTTLGAANDFTCGGNASPDVIYEFTCPASGLYLISLCGSSYDTRLEVRTNGACPGTDQVNCNDDACGLQSELSLALTGGVQYFVIVDGFSNANEAGDYQLSIGPDQVGRCCYAGGCATVSRTVCNQFFGGTWTPGITCAEEPCDEVPTFNCDRQPDGLFDNGDGTLTFRQTTNGFDVPPLYNGPTQVAGSVCAPFSGFGIYSWWDGDYGWRHFWPDWSNPNLTIQSVQIIVCAYDVDHLTCVQNNPPEDCELDHIYVDGSLQTPTYLIGDDGVWMTTTFDVGPAALLDNGFLDVWMDIDVWHNVCSWATTLDYAQLVVTYAPRQGENHPPYTPTGYAFPECVDDNTDMCVVVTGPNPADPDAGDVVNYTYRWFVANASTGWGFVDDELNPNHPVNHPGSCVPSTDSDVGDLWRVLVFAVDNHGAQSLQPWIVDFPAIIVDCDDPWPYQEVDMGDLTRCNYPTLTNNPAHGLSGIAWLGDGITGEANPNILNLDAADDGVVILAPNGYWTPCQLEAVLVTVTAGPNYAAYAQAGGYLFLNAWKDGNLDGDFCDEIPCVGAFASEWIIQDVPVGPSTAAYQFLDPGVLDMPGRYAGVLRFRLTSRPVGRYGFGLINNNACHDMDCGTFARDFLGEVEDYIVEDLQLPVELSNFDVIGGYDQMTVSWTTASETDNDHFEIERNGSVVATITSQGAEATGHSYVWADRDVQRGASYTYTLIAVDIQGHRATLASEAGSPSEHPATIEAYALHQNYPNPFNPITTIAFDLKEAGIVSLKVFNLQGQVVATLVNGSLAQGEHNVTFDAASLPSGVYWYKLEVNGFTDTRKMLLTK